MNREEFRSDRLRAMDEVETALLPAARSFVADRDEEAFIAAVSEAFVAQWSMDFGIGDDAGAAVAWFVDRIRPAVERVVDVSDPRRIAGWLGTAVVNGAKAARAVADEGALEWTSRRDSRVRPLHVEADGQVRAVGEKFRIGEFDLSFPGEPVGPPEVWLGCRCVLAPVSLTASGWDILFLENRRTPKIVKRGERYQPKPSEGRITKRRHATEDEEKVIRRGGWLRVNERGEKPGDSGYMKKKSKVRPQLNSIEDIVESAADIDDIDDINIDDMDELDDDDLDIVPDTIPWYGLLVPENERSGDGRSFSPGAVTWRELPLPLRWQKLDTGGHDGSFTVGTIEKIWREGDDVMASGFFVDTAEADEAVGLIMESALRGVSIDADMAEMAAEQEEGYVDFSKGRVSAATLVAIPAFHRAFVALGDFMPEEGRFRDYTVEERKHLTEVGEVLAGGGETFKRGAGWVTHPKETRKLHHYWTKGEGAAKIRWGTPGDFRRLRRHLAKYIEPAYLNRTVAQWHKDATGRWPGQHSTASVLPLGHGATAEDALHQGSRVHAGEHAAAAQRATAMQSVPEGAGRTGPGTAHGARTEAGGASQLPQDGVHQRSPVHTGEHPHRLAGQANLSDVQAGALHAAPQDAAGAAVGEDRRGRAGRVLAVDGSQDGRSTAVAGGPPLRGHQRGAARFGEDAQSPPRGVGVGERADTERHDHRPSVQGQVVLQSGASGAGHGFGKHETAVAASSACAPCINLIAAAVAPVPVHFFENPELTGPTPLTVDGDHVYGHLATWGTCHIGIKNVCTQAPASAHDYAYFRTGSVHTDKGRVSVGQITMDTGHADLGNNARAAASHYDNTGTAVADVAAGEDEYGIWVSGKIRDTATDEQRHALAAGALSGDWRAIGGNLELVAALVVNVPGFPIPRPALAASADEQRSLVAAGVVTTIEAPDGSGAAAPTASVEEIAEAVEDYSARKQQRTAKISGARAAINLERVDRINRTIGVCSPSP